MASFAQGGLIDRMSNSSGSSFTVTVGGAYLRVLTPTVDLAPVTLPNATLVVTGRSHRIYNASATNRLLVRYQDSTFLCYIPPLSERIFTLTDNSTDNGVWAFQNPVDVRSPLKLEQSLVPDAKLNISANRINQADGTSLSTPVIKGAFNSFPLTTIDFQTGTVTGGTVTVSGGTFAIPSSVSGQFRRVAFAYNSPLNSVDTLWSAEAASVGALTAPESLFSGLSGTALGYIDLQATATSGPGAYKSANAATNVIVNQVSNTPTIVRFATTGGGGDSTAGEINVVSNPSDAVGWAASNTGIAVATTTTTTDLPLSGIISTAIKITPVSGTDYVRYRFTMPASLKARSLKIEWYQRPLSGYASGDLKVELYTNSASNYGGSYVQVSLDTDVSGVSSIPNVAGKFQSSFASNTLDYYELRIVRVAGTTALNLASVIVGPGIQPQGAVVQDPVTFTPTFNGVTINTGTSRASYQRVGNMAFVSVQANASADATATVTFDASSLFSGASIDSSFFAGSPIQSVGWGEFRASTGEVYLVDVRYNGSGSLVEFRLNGGSAVLDASEPSSVGGVDSGDTISFRMTVPIGQWSGSGAINLARNDVEYLTNTDTSTSASNTTAFGYALSGVNFVAVSSAGATIKKRVRAVRPMGPSSGKPILEVSPDGILWIPAHTKFPYMEAGADKYGMRLVAGGTAATDADVEFGGDGANGTEAWSVYTSWLWRVVMNQPGVAVGFGMATTTSAGLVSTTAQSFAGNKTFTGIVAPSGATRWGGVLHTAAAGVTSNTLNIDFSWSALSNSGAGVYQFAGEYYQNGASAYIATISGLVHIVFRTDTSTYYCYLMNAAFNDAPGSSASISSMNAFFFNGTTETAGSTGVTSTANYIRIKVVQSGSVLSATPNTTAYMSLLS